MKKIFPIFLLLFCISAFAQQADVVDFKKVDAILYFDIEERLTMDSYEVEFDILKKTDSIYLDAVQMEFQDVLLNGKKVAYKNDGKKLLLYHKFQPSKANSLSFEFRSNPKQAKYFIGWNNEARNQIWTQGQGKYTSNWLPSIDDVNDKIEFDLTIEAPKGYEVISNGKLLSKTESNQGFLWEYDMQKPMPSYLVAMVIGVYNKLEVVSKTGIPLEMYYYPEDSLKAAPTYRYTKEIFDFLEEEITYPYPWQNYKQVPVHDFLYAGMENTSCTIFSDVYVIDETAFIDKNYVNVNAHELAHQWFGNLVTASSSKHHWLQEGFSTYYALLAEKEVFGEDYFYWNLYEYAQELATQDRLGNSTAVLHAKASSATFYKKGALVLYMLREKVGDEAFKKAVKNYLEKYAFSNVKTSDFIQEVTLVSNQNLDAFVAKWLEDKRFYLEEVEASLKRNSEFINEYLMVDCAAVNSKCAYYLTSGISDEAKSKIISQVPQLITSEVFKSSVKVRQAIALHVTEIPLHLKKDFESLLDDPSYITIESALYSLWVNFPEGRAAYLDKTKNIIGLPNKNVRLLWLTLALVSPEYHVAEKQAYLDALIRFTSPAYNYEIRMNAFSYLDLIGVVTEEILEHYKEAEQHHNWRLKKFAKAFAEKNKRNTN
ncbi:M1 family metallopeptidase [Oceanihabitans sediminis]|uniref:M1 family metallopeptidase n=1 Tax=Oceanihabitans sediminis TaxID=1812012 RepID=UPI000931376F|nr:M1 family metallopeptidase [Oceanihabitans sediminis]MDX1277864.1 M1 family metallopeptidase [Oceanihabitans sediminis]MDX1774479.1 M1 family metallopeptidase [Oceanihabitans sediminis]